MRRTFDSKFKAQKDHFAKYLADAFSAFAVAQSSSQKSPPMTPVDMA